LNVRPELEREYVKCLNKLLVSHSWVRKVARREENAPSSKLRPAQLPFGFRPFSSTLLEHYLRSFTTFSIWHNSFFSTLDTHSVSSAKRFPLSTCPPLPALSLPICLVPFLTPLLVYPPPPSPSPSLFFRFQFLSLLFGLSITNIFLPFFYVLQSTVLFTHRC